MNKAELITELHDKVALNITKEATEIVVDTLLEILKTTLQAGDSIDIRNFGRLYPKEFKQREGRNPATGGLMTIPGKRKAIFRQGLILNKALNS